MGGVPNQSHNTMESMECSAVYIDCRVKSERLVCRSSDDASCSSLVLADEPESLGSDLGLLLQVCKQSMFVPFPLLADARYFIRLAHGG